ncbi:MAG: 5'-nucleotidase C-terminal domain-containing protein [Actinobacteria bacterium]|nr:5'-nucleotidase C-terminal domain-containing protein [Actinomycetota bacterium]
MRRVIAGVGLAVCLAVAAPSALARVDAQAATQAPVSVQLLAINDYHGNIEPPGGTLFGQPAGGAEYLATHIAALKAQNPNSIVVAAGDLIGASPLASALFHDEPSIETLNEAGLQVASIGNHEFDEGKDELLRMQRGGCHPKDGCQDGDPFEGSDFDYLAANVEVQVTAAQRTAYTKALAAYTKARAAYTKAVARYKQRLKTKRTACTRNPRSAACKRKVTAPRRFTRKRPAAPTAKPLFPATKVITTGGIKVGFIGMTLEGTPTIVTPSGVAGLRFLDEADTANKYAAELKKQEVNTIVVLIHEGGLQTGGLSDCTGMSGAIVDIVNRMSSDIDVVISGHTHTQYICTIGSKLVTSANSFGRVVTDIDLTVESTTGRVVTKTAMNTIVPRTIAKDAEETAIVEKYKRLSAPLANRVIGSISSDITRTQTLAGESALGDVIADSQLAATRDAAKGSAVIAFMNPGGIRTDLLASQISGGEQVGQVTYGEAFTVQPFGNSLVTMTLTGQQIDTLLEQQWSGGNAAAPRILQVSNGFTYTWDATKPNTDRVNIADIRLNGQAISATASYRVTVNSFMAEGGDNFLVLRDGTSRLGGEVDLDALTAYFGTSSPVPPGPRNRITRVN